MKKLISLTAIISTISICHTYASESQVRVFTCEGPNARMEVYAPSSKVYAEGGLKQSLAFTKAIGYYALDLTDAGKGKPLEPVLLSLSEDSTALVVDQFSRGFVTQIPFKGSQKDPIDFDQRFGNSAKCLFEKE